jgi:hypothetical protein
MEKIVVRDLMTNRLFVTRKENFVEMKMKDTFDEFGGKSRIDSELENETCMACNYYDGYNFQTIFLKADFSDYGDVERIDDEIEEQRILKEYEEAEFHEAFFGTREAITESFKFVDSSRYLDAWWDVEVLDKED